MFSQIALHTLDEKQYIAHSRIEFLRFFQMCLDFSDFLGGFSRVSGGFLRFRRVQGETENAQGGPGRSGVAPKVLIE